MTKNSPGCLPRLLRRFGRAAKIAASFPGDLPYRLRDDFLSAAENEFYRALRGVTGERMVICPKVSLDDIFFVPHPEKNQAYISKINRKHVDFLLCSPGSLLPLAGVELDDSSHQRPDRVARDAFVEQVFAAAGLPLVRVPVRASYQADELSEMLRDAMQGRPQPKPPAPAEPVSPEDGPPLCPKCGVRMALRRARYGANAGRQFYGCPNYPRCQQIVPVEE